MNIWGNTKTHYFEQVCIVCGGETKPTGKKAEGKMTYRKTCGSKECLSKFMSTKATKQLKQRRLAKQSGFV